MCHIIHFRLCGWREIEKGHWGAGAKVCESERERAWESVYSAVRWDLSLWCEGREDSTVSKGGAGESHTFSLTYTHVHSDSFNQLPNAAFTSVWCHGFHPGGQWVHPFTSTRRSDAAHSQCPCTPLILTMFSLLTFVGMQAVDWWAIPPPRSWEPFWPVAWVHPLLTHHTLPGRPPRPPHPPSGADPTPAPRKSGSPIRTKVPQISHAHTCPQLHPRLWPHCLEEIYSCLGRIWDRSFPGCIVTLILCIFRPC